MLFAAVVISTLSVSISAISEPPYGPWVLLCRCWRIQQEICWWESLWAWMVKSLWSGEDGSITPPAA